ncbi:response regulator transcription factor [Pseudoalteromonas sp. A3]|uniref:response regulator transcription factor n=1 Tax=Pseudoalteromonas TaxID=53246 RepID=UPI0003D593DD|nr:MULTISPECIES: response regulator transcription factor [Pseudoalteromonas]ETJ47629.1 XRE family transcriptional regulator [Pseudoalteromonas agarivorans]MCQ8889246.1 response regulator transcription factor [Pseudoalteromonas carrageenovora]MCW1719513.1 response regulator transcription factor [Pseudoalteromonas sp. A3]MDC9511073.1 response regulator transcription factor [Pseudoalteromonas sp. Angola-4]
MINVLLVEDDIDLATTIVDYLDIEDIECDHASNGVLGLNLLQINDYQMIILDVNMPKMDGLTMCKTLREQGKDIPVLMLTARDSLDNKLEGFAAGSDDYLVKPFAMKELVARVQVLAKRKSGEAKRLTLANLNLDLAKRSADVEGQTLKLSPIAFKLLETLVRHAPQPVTRSAIMQAIWGEEQPDSNSLKVHVHHLRKQLEATTHQVTLETIPSVGFAITANEGQPQ